MKPKGYTARYDGHIESLDYRDGCGQLWLQCGCRDSRMYCDDTAKLPFWRRKQVIENLCDYYETVTKPVIVVLDERDKDRRELEELVARLVGEGHKITIECDNAEKREHFEDSMYLRLLSAGKKLVIDGVELGTEAEYWQWKERAKGASPNGGPRWWLATRAFWKGRQR